MHSIATGTTEAKDVWSSYFGNVNDQVQAACDQIASIPELQHGYNALGFSQGGQFIRAVVQRCQHVGPKAHTLITFGAQHQGVMNVPECVDTGNTSTSYCRTMQAIIERYGFFCGTIRQRVGAPVLFCLSKYACANT